MSLPDFLGFIISIPSIAITTFLGLALHVVVSLEAVPLAVFLGEFLGEVARQ